MSPGRHSDADRLQSHQESSLRTKYISIFLQPPLHNPLYLFFSFFKGEQMPVPLIHTFQSEHIHLYLCLGLTGAHSRRKPSELPVAVKALSTFPLTNDPAAAARILMWLSTGVVAPFLKYRACQLPLCSSQRHKASHNNHRLDASHTACVSERACARACVFLFVVVANPCAAFFQRERERER